MFIIVGNIFLKNFQGLAIFPFIILKNRVLKENKRILNHEKIHLRQQLEMFWFLFFLWYGIEFLIRLIWYKRFSVAYQNLSFEREAYQNENNFDYLKKRKIWSFINYL